MNHFLLPDAGPGGAEGAGGRYGSFAMDQLIGELVKRGANRSTMEAKVFGGLAVISGMNSINVRERNTAFVLDYLRTERIAVVSRDMLDIYPRKVCFLPASGKAKVKRLASANTEALAAQAADPLVAREMIRNLNPDVITLDIEMPRMDGLDFLARLMRLRPMPVVMVSTLTERGADVTLKALDLGAIEFVSKPRIGVADGLRQRGADVTEKVRTASRARMRRLQSPGLSASNAGNASNAGAENAAVQAAPAPPATVGRLSTEKIIFIGASTGGTEATREMLVNLPTDSPAVVITQHMPAGFTRSYATRLDGLCRIRVAEASDGERLLPGHAYIAPGGLQMSVERSGANCIVRVQDGPPVNRHKPSVEVLFDSAARSVGRNALGVMLTGMGADGARAMGAMRDAGSWNVVQDKASCVVFGMPREAIAHGAAHEVLPLKQIAPRLVEWLRANAGAVTSRV